MDCLSCVAWSCTEFKGLSWGPSSLQGQGNRLWWWDPQYMTTGFQSLGLWSEEHGLWTQTWVQAPVPPQGSYLTIANMNIIKPTSRVVVSESHSVVSDSCDPMDCSLQGSSVHGILQARILEWVAISFSKGDLLKVRFKSLMSLPMAFCWCWSQLCLWTAILQCPVIFFF